MSGRQELVDARATCAGMDIHSASIDAAEEAGRKGARNRAGWNLPSAPMFDSYLIGQFDFNALARVCCEAWIEESGAKPSGAR